MHREASISAVAAEPYERAYHGALRSQLLRGLPPHVQGLLADAPLHVLDRASRLWEDGRRAELVVFLRALQRARARGAGGVHQGRRFAFLFAVLRWTWNRRRRIAFAGLATACAYSLARTLGVRLAIVELLQIALALWVCRRFAVSRCGGPSSRPRAPARYAGGRPLCLGASASSRLLAGGGSSRGRPWSWR